MLWGAAVSAHQVEGNQNNDWTRWERSPKRVSELKEMGKLDKYGLETFISGKSADFYHLYEQDLDLAKSLGHTCFRFSLEWSRLEPEQGQFSDSEFVYYRRVIGACRKRGIEPIVTIWHWTNPLWVEAYGGWPNRRVVTDFARFAKKVAEELGSEVKYWITVNEPEVFATNAYWTKKRPPQEKSLLKLRRSSLHLVRAHQAAYRAIKQLNPGSEISIAKHNVIIDPANKGLASKALSALANYLWNDWWVKKLDPTVDYWGLNYYLYRTIGISFFPLRAIYTGDNNNQYIARAARQLHLQTNKAIFITENGTWQSDEVRQQFIREAVDTLPKLNKEGVPIIGYCHWSLLDNFEWESGYTEQFGLVHVDFATQVRTPKKSALFYKNRLREIDKNI